MILLTLLASLSFAQSTGTASGSAPVLGINETTTDRNNGIDIRELQRGRPTITGTPRYTNGICFNATGTDCQTSAASGPPFNSSTTFNGAQFGHLLNSTNTVTVGSNATGGRTNLTVYGVVQSSTPIPSISCDTASPIDPNSTDQAGGFTCANGASKCTITFSTPRATRPWCFCASQTTTRVWYADSVTTTSVECNDAGVNCNGERVAYFCFGSP